MTAAEKRSRWKIAKLRLTELKKQRRSLVVEFLKRQEEVQKDSLAKRISSL